MGGNLSVRCNQGGGEHSCSKGSGGCSGDGVCRVAVVEVEWVTMVERVCAAAMMVWWLWWRGCVWL